MHSLDSAALDDNSTSMPTTFFLSIERSESILGLFCSFDLLYNNFSYVQGLPMEWTVDHNFNLPYGLLSSTSLVQL
jgi:hypothetical protein